MLSVRCTRDGVYGARCAVQAAMYNQCAKQAEDKAYCCCNWRFCLGAFSTLTSHWSSCRKGLLIRHVNFCFAGELQHLMEAGLWVDAHQLLCIHLAPQLFLASHPQAGGIPSEQQQQLEDELQQLISRLTSHAVRISAQAGSRLQPDAELDAVSWSHGAGVYAIFYELRVRQLLLTDLSCL